MKKETILIAHNYTQNSFACVSFSLAHYWAENGHDVVFLSYRPYFIEPIVENVCNNNIYVHSWSSSKRPTSIQDVWHFIKIYRKYRPQIIIGHFVGANISIFVSKILTFGKVKTFAYYHTLSSQQYLDGGENKFKKIRKYFFYKFFCDFTLPNSHKAALDYKNHYGLSNFIVHNTPLVDRYIPKLNKQIVLKGPLVIGFLGRLDKSKGINELIEAIIELDENNFVFNIAGSGALESKVTQIYYDKKNVNYFGNIDYSECDKFISNCDVIIIPSITDNLVTVGIETLMNNVCLVISKNTGLSEYLDNMEDAILIEPNSKDIVLKMVWLFQNRLKLKTIAEKGRIKYEKKLNMVSYFKTMDKIILNK